MSGRSKVKRILITGAGGFIGSHLARELYRQGLFVIVVDQKSSDMQAVTHIDESGRLQTVSERENRLYYQLIEKFLKKTGVPVLLNTSFNENEPIVNTPQEAIECFLRTKMDVLVLGNFFAKKSDLLNPCQKLINPF